MRTWFAADKTGFHMLHTLFQTTLKYQPISRYDEWFVTKLLVDDGAVHGVVAIELMSGRSGDPGQGCHPLHWWLRPRLSFYDECQHQHWRWHGAGLSCGRAAQRHGVRAVPSDRSAVHRYPDHRGRPSRRRLDAQQGRLPLSAGLQPGKAEPNPVLRCMELGPRDRLSQAFVRGDGKGRTIKGPTATWSISICAIWAKKRSTRSCRWCASYA